MPRPGPRPYECVRRAWHSERHQPIRGSLIQEIFRVVIEVHCSATKRNKEWQEKLPIVVLRAEEIMYSKANSEAEYMDLKTLWDRVNDAINTIIRLDDSMETGDFLQPCIEAALHLGCIPRRASRSQRDNDPCRYLRPNAQESISSCHSGLKNSIISPHCMALYSDIFTNAPVSPLDASALDDAPFGNFPLHFPSQTSSSQFIPQTCTASVQGHSVYPLYQWSCNTMSKKTNADDEDAPEEPRAARLSKMPETASPPPPPSCDLSLTLGPCWGAKDIDMQSHHQEFCNTESKIPNFKELHLFSKDFAGEFLTTDHPSKKRKALPLTLTLCCPAEQMLWNSPSKLPR